MPFKVASHLVRTNGIDSEPEVCSSMSKHFIEPKKTVKPNRRALTVRRNGQQQAAFFLPVIQCAASENTFFLELKWLP